MKYICKCGNESSITLSNFLLGKRCKVCVIEFRRKKYQFDYEYVKNYFKEHGCELLEEIYINSLTKMKYKCSCGNISSISFSNFKKGKRCSECGVEKAHKKQRNDINNIRLLFTNEGYTLLTNNYKNGEQLLDYVCDKGHYGQTTYNRFARGKRCGTCYHLSTRGENSPHWNPNLTKEDRENSRKTIEYVQWLNDVFKRDNYTCQHCKSCGGRLQAHHLNGYHWYKEGRTDVNNGVTLCKKCHKEFHKIYGNKNNTLKQYNEWNERKY